ncbi:hypothetical protein ECZU51_53590 [Escherichia coli]|nr:hypothetical protein ECZU51_53590 [Escherichia coli]
MATIFPPTGESAYPAFCHRLAAQFAARLRMFIATGQPMNGLRLLLFIVNKQAALLVNKLDAQMAAFQ